ncbi:smc n terminal domain-containing protein, partial [Cystoisospora suis]
MAPSDLSQRSSEGGRGRRLAEGGGWRSEKTAKQFPFYKECLPGQLLQVRLHNWMAYEGPVEVNFRPGVNLIAAGNGVGKSSLLCAMAFGLGYDVSHITQRGRKLRDFIKAGQTACSVSCILVGRETGDFIHTTRQLRL